MIEVKKKQRILIVRYSDFIIPDTVIHHIEILKNFGYFWFGKIGVVPSKKTLQLIMKDSDYLVILHNRLHSYICRVSELANSRPQDGYPEYYKDAFYNVGQELSIYFKVIEIAKLPKSYLDDFILMSTKMSASVAINRSMSSIFIAESVKDIVFNEVINGN